MLEEESINKRLLQHCGFKSTDAFGGLFNKKNCSGYPYVLIREEIVKEYSEQPGADVDQ